MDKIMNASIRLCTKCLNTLEIKYLVTRSCSLCSLFRTDYQSNRGTIISSRKNGFLTGSSSFMQLMSLSQYSQNRQDLLSLSAPFRKKGFSSGALPQQQVILRSFANDASQPPNPLPPRKKSKDKSRKSPISWRNLIIVSGIGGVLLLGMNYVKKEKELKREKAKNLKMGKAKLGGDWTLIDHHGKVRSSHDFRGQWLLIYFGFTNCPDICPEEIEKIVSVIDKTDADSSLPKIQPIIITVDPTRDTPEAMKEYCAEFSPRLLGFSGSQEQIHATTRAYRVYYSQGPKDEDNDYIVDHSIISYLVNPAGEFVDYFGQNKKDEEMYKSIKLHIVSYLRQEKGQK